MKITATFTQLGNCQHVVYTRPFSTLDRFMEDVLMFSVGYVDQRKVRYSGMQVSLLEQTKEITLRGGDKVYGKATYSID